MNINVLLGGGGGGRGRQNKLSAKHTSNTATQTIKTSSSGAMGMLRGAGQMGRSALGGSEPFLSTTANLLRVGVFYGMVKTAEKGLGVMSQYRESRSGESTLEGNYRAKLKTGVNLGLNIVYGEIKNQLFTQPKIVRQNMSINYDRDLYNYSIYGEKYKFR